MKLLAPIKDHHSERQLFVARVALSSVIAILLLGTVIGRLVQLQVFDYELFAEKSQGNRVRIEPVRPFEPTAADLAEYAGGYLSDEAEVTYWFEVENGSRYQHWAFTTAPAPGFLSGLGQLGHQSAFRSWVGAPSH